MFDFIKGKLTNITPNRVTIEANGIGYSILVPVNFFAKEENTTLYISFIVREDSHTLYGFQHAQERDFFNSLINVQGIGPKTGLAIIGNISFSDLAVAIQRKDILTLCKVPGIGKKTAERLLIEMKDVFPEMLHLASKQDDPSTKHSKDAVSALMNLGYSQHAARSAVQKALQHDPTSDLPTLITSSLKHCK